MQYATQPMQYATQPMQYATKPVQYATQPMQYATQPVQYATQPMQYATQPAANRDTAQHGGCLSRFNTPAAVHTTPAASYSLQNNPSLSPPFNRPTSPPFNRPTSPPRNQPISAQPLSYGAQYVLPATALAHSAPRLFEALNANRGGFLTPQATRVAGWKTDVSRPHAHLTKADLLPPAQHARLALAINEGGFELQRR